MEWFNPFGLVFIAIIMIPNIVYATQENCLTLYDVFTVLSDRTHNSYFSSLLDDFAKEFSDDHYIGLTVEQARYLNILIIVVLMTFDDFKQGDSL